MKITEGKHYRVVQGPLGIYSHGHAIIRLRGKHLIFNIIFGGVINVWPLQHIAYVMVSITYDL